MVVDLGWDHPQCREARLCAAGEPWQTPGGGLRSSGARMGPSSMLAGGMLSQVSPPGLKARRVHTVAKDAGGSTRDVVSPFPKRVFSRKAKAGNTQLAKKSAKHSSSTEYSIW